MRVRTHQQRAPRLGELELQVIEYIWRFGRGDAKGIQQDFHIRRRISLSTVQSTLERLFRKGLLGRTKISHAYVYEPALSRQELIAQVIKDVITDLADGSLERAISGFLDLADRADEETLERLERMIARRRRKPEASG